MGFTTVIGTPSEYPWPQYRLYAGTAVDRSPVRGLERAGRGRHFLRRGGHHLFRRDPIWGFPRWRGSSSLPDERWLGQVQGSTVCAKKGRKNVRRIARSRAWRGFW